ncbi:hypothetical protein P7C70_g8456, partial [Phenoliferia sp. Uapishka_3]
RTTTPPPPLLPPSDNPCFPFLDPEQHYWAQWAAQYNLPATCLDDMFKLQDFRPDGRVFESSKALRKLVDEIPQEVPLRYETVEIVVEWTREEREQARVPTTSGQSKARKSKARPKCKDAKSSGVPKSLDGVKVKFSFIPLQTALLSLAGNTTFADATDWTSRRIINSDGHHVLSEPRDGTVWKNLEVKLVFVADILGNVEKEVRALPLGADLWNEVQRRFLLQFPFPELLFFARGTAFGNWTGEQCGQCIKIFPGIVAGLGLPPATTLIVRAYAEIFMISRFRRHSNHVTGEPESATALTTTIDRLQAAHRSFIESIEEGFACARPMGIGNLRRVHSWFHYKLGVERHGSLKGVSTEGPERLHQTFEKAPYNVSSKKRTADKEILLRNEDRHALQHLQQQVEFAGIPSMEEIALASQPGRRRRRGKIVLDPGAGVRTGSDDYRNTAVLTGSPLEIANALAQPAFPNAIRTFILTSHLFRKDRQAYGHTGFKIRTFGLFYTTFSRPDPTRDPTYTPEDVMSCVRARPTWTYSDEDAMVGPRYDFICVKSETDGEVRHRIARVKVIFRFHRPEVHDAHVYVEWLSLTSTTPDPETGWLKYTKTDDVEVINAARVVSAVALQPVFHRESLMRRVDIYEKHDDFFLLKGVTDELYDYYHEFQDTFVE